MRLCQADRNLLIPPDFVVGGRDVTLSILGIKEVDVELVWDPPWDPSMMSDAAELQLGFM